MATKVQKVTIKKQRSKFTNMLLAFLRRFHLMLFFIFVVALLAVGVIMLNQTLTETSVDDFATDPVTSNTTTVTQSTLDKVESLHTSDNPTDADIPTSGRTNPFAE